MDYGHIAATHAEAIHCFYREHLNAYLNLHRTSAHADVEVDVREENEGATGAFKRLWRRYRGIERLERFLRPGASIDLLRDRLRYLATPKLPSNAVSQAEAVGWFSAERPWDCGLY